MTALTCKEGRAHVLARAFSTKVRANTPIYTESHHESTTVTLFTPGAGSATFAATAINQTERKIDRVMIPFAALEPVQTGIGSRFTT